MAEISGLTYDAGALIALERGDRRMWALHDESLRRGILPTVPSAVLAQAWRGGPQPALSRGLRGCSVNVLDERQGRAAGSVCASAGTNDIVDAVVVIGAVQRGESVVTSDGPDVRDLRSALGVGLKIIEI